MTYKVLKFGGSILKNCTDFIRASNIIESEIKIRNFPIPVVSAMQGVTDQISGVIDTAFNHKQFDTESLIDDLYKRSLDVLPEGIKSESLMDEFQQLKHVIEYIKSAGELTDSVYAYIISRGERFSCYILSEHLTARGIKNQCYAGEDILVTDENYRDALVNLELTRERLFDKLRPSLVKGVVPIVAGFSGRSRTGRISVLGRGGTDDTAVCIGYCLGVNDVVKYVDQKGIMTIDPLFLDDLKTKLPELLAAFGGLPEPELIPYLSYVEASELMREERIKVVHYKVLNPLIEGDIKFHIKDVSNPKKPGSVIGPENDNNSACYGRPKAISFQRKLVGIRLLPAQSHTPTEVYARIFQVLANRGVDIRYISISGYQISLLMPITNLEDAFEALSELELAVEVTKLPGLKATFSIVGSGMRGVRGFLSRVTGTLARHGVNIEQATQPYSENIIRFSVDDEYLPLAVCSVYKEFFG